MLPELGGGDGRYGEGCRCWYAKIEDRRMCSKKTGENRQRTRYDMIIMIILLAVDDYDYDNKF